MNTTDQPETELAAETAPDRIAGREIAMGAMALVILVLLGVIGYLLLRSHGPVGSSPTGGTASTTALTATESGNLNETSTYYEITALYPTSTPLAATAGSAQNLAAIAAMKRFEQNAIAQFKKDGNFAHLTHDDVQMLGLDQRKESLDISYKAAASPTSASYLFTIVEDTLGAHPNTVYRTFTWNAKTGAVTSLADLFPAKSDYLGFLSQKARTLLPPVIARNEGVAQGDVDQSMLADGTTPSADNFADWYLDGPDLVIVFPPYQVAPYAAGPQTLRIPTVQLPAAPATYTHVSDWGTLY